MFALRHKKSGKLVGVYVSSMGEGDFAGDVKHRLFAGTLASIWVVRDREVAEKAAVTDTEAYNADYDTPMNPYVGELEVVELMIKEKKK